MFLEYLGPVPKDHGYQYATESETVPSLVSKVIEEDNTHQLFCAFLPGTFNSKKCWYFQLSAKPNLPAGLLPMFFSPTLFFSTQQLLSTECGCQALYFS